MQTLRDFSPWHLWPSYVLWSNGRWESGGKQKRSFSCPSKMSSCNCHTEKGENRECYNKGVRSAFQSSSPSFQFFFFTSRSVLSSTITFKTLTVGRVSKYVKGKWFGKPFLEVNKKKWKQNSVVTFHSLLLFRIHKHWTKSSVRGGDRKDNCVSWRYFTLKLE